jgi:DNA-directed RNA polymerase subunit RPC12/RpoP
MNYLADSGAEITPWAFVSLVPLLILFFVWFISAVVAALIAADRNHNPVLFGLCTFFFLGPLGVGFALIAPDQTPQKRPVPDGRRRFICPRCGADSDIPDADTSYDCWRCGEVRKVKAKATAAKS